jgi:DNA-binding transcriptional ArsR family regulator
MSAPRRTVYLDAEQLRTLAHPLRMRLLSVLRLEGPATATQLARRLATDSGKTSYHLRQLADASLVAEDTARGNRRDRWWRALHDSTHWNPADHLHDPDTAAATEWLAGHAVRLHAQWSDTFAQSQDAWSPEWVDASTLSDYLLELTPGRLRQLVEELDAVIERYRGDADHHNEEGTEAERVTVVLHAFPNSSPVS